MFYRASLDFAAKSSLDQSDAAICDVTIFVALQNGGHVCCEWCLCKTMSDFASKIAFPRPISAKKKNKHQLFSPAVR